MKIRTLQNTDQKKLERFLSSHAETSMFLLSNMRNAGLEYQDKDYHGEYFGAFDEAKNITGVLAHYWNGNIMMQATNQRILNDLVIAFRKAVLRPIAGILGPDDQVEIVIQKLRLGDKLYSMNRTEGLYTLNLSALSLPINFDFNCTEVVEAREIDQATLIRWIKAYDIEALGSDDDEALDKHVKNRVDRIINNKNHWILLVNGEPVSLSGFNARLTDILQIGPVWTDPKHRSKGYARTLVALTLRKAKEQGIKKAILFTDNQAAIKAYEAIGFRKIGTYHLALLKKPFVFE
jgi:GNAT superfamily N-acetyltransferase